MWHLFIANLKMLFRNKESLFWSLMFPLMFTFIFGSFFGNGANQRITIAVINQSDSEIAKTIESEIKKLELFNLNEEEKIKEAKKLVDEDKISGVIIIPENFGHLQIPESPKNIKVYYDPANNQASAIMNGFLDKFITNINLNIQNATPIFGIETEERDSSSRRDFNYFSFVLIGLIGMALMNSSIQGIGIAMSKYREDKILKRLTTTPIKRWNFIAAEVLSRLMLNFVQITLILTVGTNAFGAKIGNIPGIYLLSLIGAILFQSIGFVVASLSKSTQAAEGMSTAIAIPLMFLSGVFFPINLLPEWLYSIVKYLPLAPLLREMRAVGLENTSVLSNSSNMLVVSAWIISMFLIASYKFKFTDE
jgi:ABC-2 type transport system permease protein